MRNTVKKYYEYVHSAVEGILNSEENSKAIEEGARLIAERIVQDKLVYLIGPGGHSNLSTEECLCRAGMLVQLSPMIDATNLLHGTTKTRFLQRSNGAYAKGLLEEYGLEAGDVLIIINAYGINSLTVDMAVEGRKQGVKIIAISSAEFAKRLPSEHPARHPSGKSLRDVCDVFIDSKMPFEDAVIEIEDVEQPVGPTSTLCNVFSINILMLSAVERIVEMGHKPKIWRSINLPGGDEYNKSYFKEYGQRIKFLL